MMKVIPALVFANAVIKLALVGAIVFMLTNPDLPQFENKSLTLRAVIYPIFAMIVPATYFLKGRGSDYPHLVDVLWSFTFTFDIVSNDLHFYGSYANYDDIVHFINATPYMFLLVGLRLSLGRLNKIKLGFWGAVLVAFIFFVALHAVWEMYERMMDRYFGTELQPGGMVEATDNNFFSIVGAVLAIVILAYWRKSRSFDNYLISPATSYLEKLVVSEGEIKNRRLTNIGM